MDTAVNQTGGLFTFTAESCDSTQQIVLYCANIIAIPELALAFKWHPKYSKKIFIAIIIAN